MTSNADTGCCRGGTVSFTDRRNRVNELQEDDLDCRPAGAGKPGPYTRLYLTPTHSHRRSCPASPGLTQGPGAAAQTVAAFGGYGSSAQKPRTYLPAGRSQNNATPAVPRPRADGRSRHRGHRLRPAYSRKGRRRAGRASSAERSTRPRAARTSPPSEFSSGPSFWHRESAQGPARDLIRLPTGPLTHGPAAQPIDLAERHRWPSAGRPLAPIRRFRRWCAGLWMWGRHRV
jgi:hypothetical protein